MKVASIQMSVVEGDKEATLAKAAEKIAQCADADLIILPEMWNLGFISFDRYESEAEDKNGPTLTMLRGMAKQTGSYLHTGSFVEKEEGKYYNSSYLISPQGELVGHYRKIHLFGYNSKETQILTPGDAVSVVDTPLGKIGLATCFDLRFPELFRRMVEKGAEIFLVCSAWPYPRLEPWLMLNRVRALENQCMLISSNSVGMNQGVQFVGHSMVVDPWGVIVAGGGDEETIVRAEIDLKEVTAARSNFPGLASKVAWLN
ncbi:MAG: carbon-nitrogen family hydrolase [Desulfobacterium sp.]|nr:carbon-nitrogen family hydrolase [Desulfobacterium sp.]